MYILRSSTLPFIYLLHIVHQLPIGVESVHIIYFISIRKYVWLECRLFIPGIAQGSHFGNTIKNIGK